MKGILLAVISLLIIGQVLCTDIKCAFGPTPWKSQLRYQVSERETLTDTLYDGVYIIIDTKDGYVSQEIMNIGSFESTNLRTFGRFVKKGDTVINIGAHMGLEAIVYGKIIG